MVPAHVDCVLYLVIVIEIVGKELWLVKEKMVVDVSNVRQNQYPVIINLQTKMVTMTTNSINTTWKANKNKPHRLYVRTTTQEF